MRCAFWVGILAAAVSAEELPEESRLSASRWPFGDVRFHHALPEGTTASEKPGVRKGKLGKLAFFFVDLDGDGAYGEKGVDGWALTGMNYVLPLEGTAIIELARLTWEVAPDGKTVRWRAERVPVDPDQEKVFRQFNYWRLINGLCPVDFDPEVSSWCAEHCAWMEDNGMKHYAEDGDSAMTERGKYAGAHSMLTEEAPGMGVLMCYASFYHRLPLFDPGTRAIGIGRSARYTAIDGMTRVEPRAWQDPILVPAPYSALQPTHFPGETPRPYPEDVEQAGFPITLTFREGAITNAAATLSLVRGRGRTEVPVLVSSPEKPANATRPDNRKSICVIPTAPLEPNARYEVKVSYLRDGEPCSHEWVFTTGHARPVWQR